MKLTDRERRAHELGWLEAQQKSAESLAGGLRGQAAAVRAEQATTLLGRMRAAFLWELTEAWCARLEAMAAELERQAAALMPNLQQRRAALGRPVSRWPWKRKV